MRPLSAQRSVAGKATLIIGLVLLAIQFVAIIFAPWIAPYSPETADPINALQEPSLIHFSAPMCPAWTFFPVSFSRPESTF